MKQIINKIHNCRNQDILPLIPDKFISIFLEDMPYNIINCDWDKKQNLQEYWKLRLNKLKDNGCFVLFGSEPFSTYLRMSNIKIFKYDWMWDKVNTGIFLNAKKQPLRRYEIISIFYKKQCIYNPQMQKISHEEALKKYKKIGTVIGNKNTNKITNEYKELTRKDYKINYYKYPTNIISIKYNNKECNPVHRIHPTQKPLELIEYLIKTYTNEGDLVFDGFSGSGTTAVACKNLNRNFIGCETNKDFYKKSVNRLNNTKIFIKDFFK